MPLQRVEIRVSGQVQGVFFRHNVRQEAERLGLTGWVRNESDGSVRVVAEGQKASLQKLIEWCRKGTEWAQVENIEVQWKEATAEFQGFEVR